MTPWGSPEEVERRRRIRLSVWAYAYEKLSESLVSDEAFDRECYLVDRSVDTGNLKLDAWWRKNFAPHTGQWINAHPEQGKLAAICRRLISYETQ